MLIIESWQVGRRMRHDIFVMNYAVDTVQFVSHKLRQFVIAYSRLPEAMDLHIQIFKVNLHSDGTNRSDSPA